jgi:hypothetical protein
MDLQTIEMENIIFSYFHKNNDKKDVKLSDLKKYVEALQQKFIDKPIYINYTKSSLVNAIMSHLDLLDLKNDNIVVIINETPNIKIDLYNSKIPYEIRDEYLQIFADVDREIKNKKYSEYV